MTTLENAKMESLKDKISKEEVKVEEKESFIKKIIKKAKSKKNGK